LRPVTGRSIAALVAVIAAGLLSACEEPLPRLYQEFMDDRIAREGTLARCNADPEGAENDIECANARRASAVVALREERERSETLERESEMKLEALRDEIAERARRAREAAILAAAAEEAAYEALWRFDLGEDSESALQPVTVPPGATRVPPNDSRSNPLREFEAPSGFSTR